MIPLRDANPSRTVPFVTYLFIGANIAVFLLELSLGRRAEAFIGRFGVVPAAWTGAAGEGYPGPGTLVTLLTSMFLHGGWMHLLGNMLFLHIFGDNVEDRFGHARYAFFYVVCGMAAALTQVFVNAASQAPMVGASGAIAGVMGAYVFMYPRAKILTLVPIFLFLQLIELPAFVFLGLWFLMQIVSGMMSLGIGADAGGVAWWAHIGGFGAGAFMLPFLLRRRS